MVQDNNPFKFLNQKSIVMGEILKSLAIASLSFGVAFSNIHGYETREKCESAVEKITARVESYTEWDDGLVLTARTYEKQRYVMTIHLPFALKSVIREGFPVDTKIEFPLQFCKQIDINNYSKRNHFGQVGKIFYAEDFHISDIELAK